MKTLIKINRKSIKRNPTAGRTEYYIQGPMDVTFSIESNDIPSFIYKEPFFIRERADNSTVKSFKGDIAGPVSIEQISEWTKCKELRIDIKNNIETIYTRTPEPNYLYSYVDTKVKCNNCGKLINVNKIEQDELEDVLVDICPHCGHFDTFDYEYEDINKVVNKLMRDAYYISK